MRVSQMSQIEKEVVEEAVGEQGVRRGSEENLHNVLTLNL